MRNNNKKFSTKLDFLILLIYVYEKKLSYLQLVTSLIGKITFE
jgi:hypothetical protein